jgi:hypothetical protein
VSPRFLVLAAAAVVTALVLAGAAWADRGSYAGVSFAAFTIAPGNMDCVQVDDDVVGWTGDCDPINVLFPGQTLQGVIARLHAAGWSDTAGSTQWLYFGDTTLVPVAAQLAVASASDSTMRYHVRLWQAGPGLVVGAVHHEHGAPHRIDMGWDMAESFLAQPLCSTWCRSVTFSSQWSAQNGSPRWRGWSNDATATVIPVGRKYAQRARAGLTPGTRGS